MIENLQLVAIVKRASNIRLFRIPLHQDLQITLTSNWDAQYKGFLNDVQRIGFDAGYDPEDHEIFCLKKYAPPAWLQGETSLTAPDLDVISNDDALVNSIKGIAGFAKTEEGEEIIMFQNFSLSHVIRPGRFLFLALRNSLWKSSTIGC